MIGFFTGIPFIDATTVNGLCPGDVVEIYGDSACAKTEIAMQIALKCILPRAVGGSESSLVYYDNDFKFDSLRFTHLVRSRLVSLMHDFDIKQQQQQTNINTAETTTNNQITSLHSLNESDLQAVLESCLERFFVIRDVLDFIFSLKALPDLLDEAFEKGAPFRAIVVDSVAPWFYSLHDQEPSLRSMYYRDVSRYIRELMDDYLLVVFATKYAISAAPNNRKLSSYVEYLDSDWVRLVRMRISLLADRTKPDTFYATFVLPTQWRGHSSNLYLVTNNNNNNNNNNAAAAVTNNASTTTISNVVTVNIAAIKSTKPLRSRRWIVRVNDNGARFEAPIVSSSSQMTQQRATTILTQSLDSQQTQ